MSSEELAQWSFFEGVRLRWQNLWWQRTIRRGEGKRSLCNTPHNPPHTCGSRIHSIPRLEPPPRSIPDDCGCSSSRPQANSVPPSLAGILQTPPLPGPPQPPPAARGLSLGSVERSIRKLNSCAAPRRRAIQCSLRSPRPAVGVDGRPECYRTCNAPAGNVTRASTSE